ncbi:MAG TPA: cob(I)yrinic acid a,c-diamide adenosyltransferase [Lachnospiraceae bacterium]|nr:cob(I)yrinic acid a,c-diamide adenosyltransferase [Lachnospiraceae bacterium]
MEKKNKFGLIHIYCGDGKGKTTSAVGLCVRACGRERKCLWTSFLKDYDSGEFMGEKPFTLYEGEPVRQFVFTMTEEQKQATAKEHTDRLCAVFHKASEEKYDLLVLDEVIASCNLNLIPVELLVKLLQEKPAQLEVVMTGRDPRPELVELADYVSEIHPVKHPYDKGIASREGIES